LKGGGYDLTVYLTHYIHLVMLEGKAENWIEKCLPVNNSRDKHNQM